MDDKEFEDSHKKWLEKYHEEHSIKCPYCGTKQSEETLYEHITYHGDDGEKEETCSHCDEKFMVKERVDRTWETKKKGDDEDAR